VNQIDVSDWREFWLIDLFHMKNTKSITAASLIPDSGEIPYVTAQAGNNGIQMYVDCPPEWLDKGDCILIGGKTLTFSYQDQDFCSNDSHNIALYSKDDRARSLETQLFLIAALNASLAPLFSWGDSISMRRAKELTVTLPVTKDGNPDWVWMGRTMRTQIQEQEQELDVLITLGKVERQRIDVSEWGEFIIEDLFDKIERATRRTVNSYNEGAVPYVTNSAFNNGITGYLEPKSGDDIEIGQCITVNTVDGSAFWQENDFLANSSGNGLLMLRREGLNADTALFLCAALNAALEPTFTMMLTTKVVRETKIRLPQTNEGEPDWATIQNIMKAVLHRQASDLDALGTLMTSNETQQGQIVH